MIFLGSSCIYPKFCRGPARDEYLLTVPLEFTNRVYALTKEERTIREVAESVCRVMGFGGELVFDTSPAGGTLGKMIDSSRLHALGWKTATALEEGIRIDYASARKLWEPLCVPRR
jgi:nucleoside-diphosphate-sugar epimerase